ncbi:hypothetical protein ACLMJK_008980 [Lecanora helva]
MNTEPLTPVQVEVTKPQLARHEMDPSNSKSASQISFDDSSFFIVEALNAYNTVDLSAAAEQLEAQRVESKINELENQHKRLEIDALNRMLWDHRTKSIVKMEPKEDGLITPEDVALARAILDALPPSRGHSPTLGDSSLAATAADVNLAEHAEHSMIQDGNSSSSSSSDSESDIPLASLRAPEKRRQPARSAISKYKRRNVSGASRHAVRKPVANSSRVEKKTSLPSITNAATITAAMSRKLPKAATKKADKAKEVKINDKTVVTFYFFSKTVGALPVPLSDCSSFEKFFEWAEKAWSLGGGGKKGKDRIIALTLEYDDCKHPLLVLWKDMKMFEQIGSWITHAKVTKTKGTSELIVRIKPITN